MKTTKYVIVMLLSISLYIPLTQAQPAPDTRQDVQTTNRVAQDVLIIIQQEQVRFTAQKAVEEMRLQIFDQAGQLVYDSGAVTGTGTDLGLAAGRRRGGQERPVCLHALGQRSRGRRTRGCAEAISSWIGPRSATGRRIGSGSRARMTAA